MPPLVAVIRRWHPLLVKIYELSPPEGLIPIAFNDPALDAETTPIEVCLNFNPFLWKYVNLGCINGIQTYNVLNHFIEKI